MYIEILRSKLQSVIVTAANVDYRGSITLDPDLMDAARILPHQKVDVNNASNGERITTYAMPGKRGTGEVCLNGAAALKFAAGDKIHVLAYGLVQLDASGVITEPPGWEPVIVHTGVGNIPL